MEPRIREALSFPEIFSLQHIIITDAATRCCGNGRQQAFEQLTKMPIEVLPAIDVARFLPRQSAAVVLPMTLWSSLSVNSGKVSRVKEAIMRMNELGALTLGITSGKTTPLGEVCQKVIDSSIPKFEERSPACAVSWHLSRHCCCWPSVSVKSRAVNTMDQAKAYRMDVKHSAEKLAAALPAIDEKVFSIAEQWKDFPGFRFRGCRHGLASAWYSHAKMIEAAGRYSMHVNTEEWLHLNFFVANSEHTGTVALSMMPMLRWVA